MPNNDKQKRNHPPCRRKGAHSTPAALAERLRAAIKSGQQANTFKWFKKGE